MAVFALSFLRGLSFSGAEALLFQEGYVEEPCIEAPGGPDGKTFLYPYSLFNDKGEKIDCICYIEYCKQVVDAAYCDGRMAWEELKTEWKRTSPVPAENPPRFFSMEELE